MMRFLRPHALFDGDELRSDVVIALEDGIVTEIMSVSAVPKEAHLVRMNSVLGLGLFDVQVNGGGGVMLNNQPTSEGLRQIAQAHNEQGTTFILPTVITDTAEVMARASEAVINEIGRNGILGIHIEGPHINRAHKGTHNPTHIRPFDDHTLAVLSRLRQAQVPVLLTLAPERVEPGLIARLTKMGVIVSAGHSAATASETKRALAEGLRCFTHLFNGMPAMKSRSPSITGAAINSDAWCGIIVDGHHVSDTMVGLAARARPKPNRMIVVSDAMSTVGGPDQFELYGEVIRVREGRLVNASGSLAGAHINLTAAVCRMMNDVGIPLSEALKMATSNPFEMMQMDRPKFIGSRLTELSTIPVKNISLHTK